MVRLEFYRYRKYGTNNQYPIVYGAQEKKKKIWIKAYSFLFLTLE